MDELEISVDLKSPTSQLFMCLTYYTAGNWTPGDILGAMDVIEEYEKQAKDKPKHLKAVD